MARSSMKRVYVVRIVLRWMIIGAFHVNGAHDNRGSVVELNLVVSSERLMAFGTAVILARKDIGFDFGWDILARRSLHALAS